jgi:alpha-2-macroglobulin
VEVMHTAPDTITEWSGHAVCTSQTHGLGISEEATLRTFQPFFVSLSLPYSAVRGETLILPVSVFNYLSQCLVVSFI